MRNSIITTALLLSITSAFAQQLPLSSQYYTNPFVNNPAFTGNHEGTNVFLTHRSQWSGIAGAPQTSYLTVDGPIDAKNIGLGLNVYSDVTGITSRVGAFGNYSYKLKINDDNNLLFGLALGIIDNKIDFTKAVINDGNDPLLFSSQPLHKTVFSADFGVGYTWKKLEVGVAVPQIIGNKIKYLQDDGSTSYYNLARQYRGTVKYVFDIVKEKEITVYPLVMVRYTPGSVFQYDVNAVVDWKKIGWLGVTYHSNYAVAVSGGVRFKNLAVGYAYDIGISKVKSYTGSTSEFLLSYTFGRNRKDDVVAQKEEPRDTLTTAMINDLKIKSDSNQARMDRLVAEFNKLKNSAATTAKNNSTNESGVTENVIRSASSNDFVDENGMGMSGGFYVIIGTFSSKDNANKFKDANIIKGNTHTQVTQNHKTKSYYVFINKFEKQPAAEAEQLKVKTQYPDVWIEKLE